MLENNCAPDLKAMNNFEFVYFTFKLHTSLSSEHLHIFFWILEQLYCWNLEQASELLFKA